MLTLLAYLAGIWMLRLAASRRRRKSCMVGRAAPCEAGTVRCMVREPLNCNPGDSRGARSARPALRPPTSW